MLDRVRDTGRSAPYQQRGGYSHDEAAASSRRRRKFLLLTSVHFGVGLAAFLLTHDYVTGGPVTRALNAHLAATEASLAGASDTDQPTEAAVPAAASNATQIAKASEPPPVESAPAPVETIATEVVEPVPAITLATASEEPAVAQTVSEQQAVVEPASGQPAEVQAPEIPELPVAPAGEVAAGEEQQAALVAQAAKTITGAPVAQGNLAFVAGQVFKDCADCPDMVVVVPPREPTESISFVQPGQGTQLAPYAIGRTEVTFDLWDSCVRDNACAEIANDGGWGRGARPAINVSHDMIASQFLPWLSRLSGQAYLLPSAAEWDYAALGIAALGVQVASAGADSTCQVANFADGSGNAPCSDGFPATAPVGSLGSNGLGLHDMRGNVWEWLDDCWTPGFTYKVKPSERDCRRRSLRGGSWSSRAVAATEPLNGWEEAGKTKNAIGFRVLRKLP